MTCPYDPRIVRSVHLFVCRSQRFPIRRQVGPERVQWRLLSVAVQSEEQEKSAGLAVGGGKATAAPPFAPYERVWQRHLVEVVLMRERALQAQKTGLHWAFQGL